MISSIVVTGCHNIKMNVNKKIKINDNVLSVEKDIPFIRYRLDSYSEKEYNYIKEMKNKFNCSTHLVEIKLNEKTKETLDYLENNIPNLAKYVYIDVTNEDVTRGTLSEETMALLRDITVNAPDRYMLKDKSTSLDTIAAKKITSSLKPLGIMEDAVGVCSSPLSFSGLACLTAVKARELMSKYSTIADVALPSANHQCMNCCGCIRYMVVNEDTVEPAMAKVKGETNKSAKQSENKSKPNNTKKPKQTIQLGQFSL